MISCLKCNKPVKGNSRAIQCYHCNSWYHLKCSLLTLKMYNQHSNTKQLWLCRQCQSETFPFDKLDNLELNLLSFNSNTDCLCPINMSHLKLDSLPSLDLLSSINNIPCLQNVDTDLYIPSSTNFQYYSTHDT